MAEKPEYSELESRIIDLEKELSLLRSNKNTAPADEDITRILIEQAPVAVAIFDIEMKYMAASSRWIREHNLEAGNIIGRSCYDFSPSMPGYLKNLLLRGIKGEAVVSDDYSFIRPDGSVQWLQWDIRPWLKGHGSIGGIIITSSDITRFKGVEEKFREKETFFRSLIRTIPDLVWLKDPKGTYLACNSKFEKLLGASEKEITGKNDYDFMARKSADFFRKHDLEALKNGGPTKNEEQVFFADDGHMEILETIKTPMYSKDGELAGVLGIGRDITERKKNEETLRYNEKLLNEMGRMAKIGGWQFDPATGSGSWTDEVARIHDLNPGDETNMELGLSFYGEESRKKVEKAIETAIKFGTPYDLELELITKKGIRKWVHTICEPVTEEGRVVQMRGSFQDITAQKLSEQHIGHLNRVLNAIRDINILIVHESDLDVLINEGCRLLVDNLGYRSAMIVLADEDEKPVSFARAGSEEIFKPFEEAVKKDGRLSCPQNVGHDRGPEHICEASRSSGHCPYAGDALNNSVCIRLIHEGIDYGRFLIVTGEDSAMDEEEKGLLIEMTGDLAFAIKSARMEKKREASEYKHKLLEKRMLKMERLEAIGRLAGGVAHDYNNILSIITINAEFAIQDTDADSPVQDFLVEILKAARRSADITRQLLAFARKQTIVPRILDLNDCIESTLKMIRRLIGEDIDLLWYPEKGLWQVRTDPSQMDQILANLCINSRDSIKGVGKITIETRNTVFDQSYCDVHPGFIPGEFVLLVVSDNGEGIKPEDMDRIFEPFFTTKEIGKGTGLGLATIYGIVKQNNGFINVYSEREAGTSIKIYLPRVKDSVPASDKYDISEIPEGRGETVLFVEDDDGIIKFGKRILENLGYVILSANRPNDAIKIAQDHSGKISLLITDVVMPDMNGRELANRLKTLYPYMEILYMSGYTANVIAHHGVLEENINFIQKPFSQNDFARKIRAILDK